MSEGPVPVRIYLTIFACLLALTALTTGVAFIDMGPLNTVAGAHHRRRQRCCW